MKISLNSESFLPKKLLMLDLEMTGLDPAVDDILQVAAIKLELVNGQYVAGEEFNEFIKTDKQPESKFALENLAGVYKSAQTKGLELSDIAKKFYEFLGEDLGKLSPCGDCVPTDVLFLYAKNLITLSSYDGDVPVEGAFFYEYFDMNSIKLVARTKAGKKFDKELKLTSGPIHDALVDCKNQLIEMNAIIKFLLT
jgi:oligoribonuclease (3'-5' exoribonuclease)